jgi:DNA-binding Lrp family transcriptional regulator
MNVPKKYLFYILIFSSSIIFSIISGIDATVNALFIKNPFIFGFSIFFVGILVSFIFAIFLSIPFCGNSIGNRYLDPSFDGLRILKPEEVKYHLLAGIGNATYTVGYFILFTILDDPSVVLPFTQIVILYLILFEAFTEKNSLTLIEIQAAVMITIGALLGSISLSGEINVLSIVIVFCLLNPSWAILTIYQRKLKHLKIKNRYNDSINIRFWNVIFSFVMMTFFVLIYDLITGFNILLEAVKTSFYFFGWISLIASGMFIVYIFYIRALGIGKASVAQAVRSSIIIFSIPVSLILSYFSIIPPFSTDPNLLLIKICGIILIMLGISSYALTQVKAYIFINIKSKGKINQIMKDFWNVRGVTHVTAITGPYDLIVKIKTRTLMKGYERILKKVENIKDVKHYKWESVLKDWEKI